MKKAACYCRYSSDKQQQQSIEYQLEKIKEFCHNNRINLIAEYSDEAKSGTSDNREEFQKMIEDSKTSEWEFLIVYNLSRLSRNVQDQMFYQKILQQRGVLIISTEEQFDSRTAEGSFFNLITAGMNEYYSKHLAKRSWGGVMQNANKALVIGGIPPLGYDVDENKRYVINEQEAELVRFIFNKTVEGWSYSNIAKWLNDNGFLNKRGQRFSKSFTDLLRNRKYTGEYVFNLKQKKSLTGKRNIIKPENEILRIPGGMPAIVDQETFRKVQKILTKRSNYKNRGIRESSYLLTGLLKCEHCGYAYFGNTSFNRHWNYPRITYRHTRAKGADCRLKDIPQKKLDYWVKDILIPELLSSKYVPELQSIVKKQIKDKIVEIRRKIMMIEDNISLRKQRIQEMLDMSVGVSAYSRDEVDLLMRSNVEDSELIKYLRVNAENLKLPTQKKLRQWQIKMKAELDDRKFKDASKLIISRITISNEKIIVYSSSVIANQTEDVQVKLINRDIIMKIRIGN
jgi:site-specific DNA recombinase